MRLAKVQRESYGEKEIIKQLKEIEENIDFKVINKIYYPYYHFEYKVFSKGLRKMDAASGCVIDGVNGREALIDCEPGFENATIHEGQVIMVELTEKEAKEKAESFMFRSASFKMKSLTELVLEEVSLFYRPFYVVDDWKESSTNLLTVDAITADYHPI